MDRADFLKLLGLGAAVKIVESVAPTKLVAAEPPPAPPEPAPVRYPKQTYLSAYTGVYFADQAEADHWILNSHYWRT